MTTIPIDKKLLEELVDLKLKSLDDEINKILNLWEYGSPTKFLQDAKDGKIQEAENDAITLKHLLDQKEELLKVKADKDGILLVNYENVNEDEYEDLVVQFVNADIFTEDDTIATLTGNLNDGTSIIGTDSIRIVP